MDKIKFSHEVREAIARLYDSPYLQRHPLALRLAEGSSDGITRSRALRRVLLEAIRETRPPAGVPAGSSDWRRHRLLELRYVEGLSPAEAREALNVGRSQFFRDQALALDLLVEQLWERFGEQLSQETPPEDTAPAGDRDADSERPPDDSVQSAVARLSSQASNVTVPLRAVFERLRVLLDPLANDAGVALTFERIDDAVVAPVDRVMLRQVLLHIVTGLLQTAQPERLYVGVIHRKGVGGIRVVTQHGDEQVRGPLAFPVADELAAAMGATLTVIATDNARDPSPNRAIVELTWETKRPVLLVIDDNVAFVDLYRRYLAGRGWDVRGAPSAREAREYLALSLPDLILLDVLMPSEDGWETLVSIKNEPRTKDIPVIVCSVLAQERLAGTLGATGYLKKPVTQERLLAALDRWSRQTSPGPEP